MSATTDQAARHIDVEAIVAPAKDVEAYLGDFLDRRTMPDNLRAAVRYAIFGPGKRMRPVLVARSCEAVGGALADALAPAAAIELIHCFSLVHDDLPAMDDDDLRRGRPTLHKHTNEAMAILAGDMMLGLALELVTTAIKPCSLATTIAGELSAANNDMIAGQVWDSLPDFAPSVPPMERLKTIHRNKTGALLRCSVRMGALCGRASEKQLAAMTQYAEAIGLMFQVVDDVLDVTQTTEQLGKTAGKDVKQNKLTYPALIGLDASRAEIARLHREATAALDDLDAQGSGTTKPAAQRPTRWLRDLCDYMAVRSK